MDPSSSSMPSSSAAAAEPPGRITARKRRYSTARIQPTRIKKVMQSDEEIGRMVASVPVALGSVMEHFAERLLENSVNVMHQCSSKTLAPAHIFAAINRTDYLKSFLEPVINNSGVAAATSSPVTTPTPNGLIGRPFENLSAPVENRFDLSALAKHHLASNSLAAAPPDEGKRRRGRPKKVDDKEKLKSNVTTILSPSTKNGRDSSANNTLSTFNGISSDDIDKMMMPPPSFVPQRKLPPLKQAVISSPSTNPSSLSTNNATPPTSMVSSSPASEAAAAADAISA